MAPARTDTVRKMEAADWASLSDQNLLERRISKLGLRLDGTTVEPLIRQLYDGLSASLRKACAQMRVRDFVQSVEEHVRQYRMPHSRSIHAASRLTRCRH
jgi:hypothetical protein